MPRVKLRVGMEIAFGVLLALPTGYVVGLGVSVYFAYSLGNLLHLQANLAFGLMALCLLLVSSVAVLLMLRGKLRITIISPCLIMGVGMGALTAVLSGVTDGWMFIYR